MVLNESNFSFLHHASTAYMAFGGYGVNYFYTSDFLRDETNWYNMMWVWDTTNGTQNNRQRAYINGVEITSMGSGSRSGLRQSMGFGGNHQHTFLANNYPPAGTANDSWIGGHHAYTCYVNGLALDPTAFGELKNGVWIPKEYATKPSLIAQDTGTAIGDLTGQSGLAGAFDGNRFESYSDAAASGSQATGYIGKNWGSSKTVTGFILYSPTQYGFVGSGASTFTVKLYGSNSNPSNSTDGTLLYTSSSVNDNLVSTNGERGAIKYFADTTIISEETVSNFTTDTAYSYHWVTITPNTSESVHVSEIEFYEDGNTNFGTGGFRLDFNASDLNTSGSSRTDPYGSGTDQPNNTIADASGSGNHLTKTTNIASTDFTSDSPENNFCVLNSLDKSGGTITEGNLRYDTSSWDMATGTIRLPSGKWYYEVRVDAYNASANAFSVGIIQTSKIRGSGNSYYWSHSSWSTSSQGYLYGVNVNGTTEYKISAGSATSLSSHPDIVQGSVIGIFIDLESDTTSIKYNIDGGTPFELFTGMQDVDYTIGVSDYLAQLTFNFGQDSTFSGQETAGGNTDGNGKGDFHTALPSGHTDYLAICSANLANPTIGPQTSTQADDHFNTFLYTGTNATNRNIATNTFTPDWVWIKSRSQADNHVVVDVLRKNGSNFPNMHPNTTDAEANDTHPKIITNGIQVSQGLYDNNNVKFVAWTWKAGGDPDDVTGNFIKDGVAFTPTQGTIDTTKMSVNTTSGFSIVTYTANNNTKGTVTHGLNSAPNLVIIKNRDTSPNGQWVIGQDQNGFTGQLYFNNGGPFGSNSGAFDNTAPTNEVVTVNTDNTVNEGTDGFVMYSFHNVEGFSKIGSYIGNNSTDGTFVQTGFRPAFLMLVRTSDSGSFQLLDNKRNTFNSTDIYLYVPGSGSENDGSTLSTPINVDFLSNGFKLRTQESVYNSNGGTFLYMTFATQSFKFSNAR